MLNLYTLNYADFGQPSTLHARALRNDGTAVNSQLPFLNFSFGPQL